MSNLLLAGYLSDKLKKLAAEGDPNQQQNNLGQNVNAQPPAQAPPVEQVARPAPEANLSVQVPPAPGVRWIRDQFESIPPSVYISFPRHVQRIQLLLPSATQYFNIADAIRSSPHLTGGQRASALARLNTTGLAAAANQVFRIQQELERSYNLALLYQQQVSDFGILGASRMMLSYNLNPARAAYIAKAINVNNQRIANNMAPVDFSDPNNPDNAWQANVSSLIAAANWFTFGVTPSKATLQRWLLKYQLALSQAENDITKIPELYTGAAHMQRIVDYAARHVDPNVRSLADNIFRRREAVFGKFQENIVRELLGAGISYNEILRQEREKITADKALYANLTSHLTALMLIDPSLVNALPQDVRYFINTHSQELINSVNFIDDPAVRNAAQRVITEGNLSRINPEAPSIEVPYITKVQQALNHIINMNARLQSLESRSDFSPGSNEVRALMLEFVKEGMLQDIATVLPILDLPEIRAIMATERDSPFSRAASFVQRMLDNNQSPIIFALNDAYNRLQQMAPGEVPAEAKYIMHMRSTIGTLQRAYQQQQDRLRADKHGVSLINPSAFLQTIVNQLPPAPTGEQAPNIDVIMQGAGARGPTGPAEPVVAPTLGTQMNILEGYTPRLPPLDFYAQSELLSQLNKEPLKAVWFLPQEQQGQAPAQQPPNQQISGSVTATEQVNDQRRQ